MAKNKMNMGALMKVHDEQTLTIKYNPKTKNMDTETLMQRGTMVVGIVRILMDVMDDEYDFDEFIDELREEYQHGIK